MNNKKKAYKLVNNRYFKTRIWPSLPTPALYFTRIPTLASLRKTRRTRQ